MATSNATLLIAASVLFVTACTGTADTGVETAATAQLGSSSVPFAQKVVRAPDGSLRVPFLGGAFVTYNREMPIEVEQAIAGVPTDRQVIVWAGKD